MTHSLTIRLGSKPDLSWAQRIVAVQRTLGWLLVIGMIAVFVALEVWR